ncbi:hypothetical protein BDW62DRAFT_176185 [Aspergillus aurantiobrunneus]
MYNHRLAFTVYGCHQHRTNSRDRANVIVLLGSCRSFSTSRSTQCSQNSIRRFPRRGSSSRGSPDYRKAKDISYMDRGTEERNRKTESKLTKLLDTRDSSFVGEVAVGKPSHFRSRSTIPVVALVVGILVVGMAAVRSLVEGNRAVEAADNGPAGDSRLGIYNGASQYGYEIMLGRPNSCSGSPLCARRGATVAADFSFDCKWRHRAAAIRRSETKGRLRMWRRSLVVKLVGGHGCASERRSGRNSGSCLKNVSRRARIDLRSTETRNEDDEGKAKNASRHLGRAVRANNRQRSEGRAHTQEMPSFRSNAGRTIGRAC